MNQSINELINGKGVYRTTPATPGLLKIKLEQHVSLQGHVVIKTKASMAKFIYFPTLKSAANCQASLRLPRYL